jgi:hypothetical protein
MKTRLAFLILAMFATACATADVEPPPAADSSALVTRTVVNRNADGTETVTQSQITVAEQQAELARNRQLEDAYLSRPDDVAYADPPVRDGSCSWYSLKLFDQPTYSGNYICFTGNGFVNLASYCRNICLFGSCWCGLPWSKAVKSYWSGSNFGWYQQGSTECPNDDYMPAYEARATVSSCIQSSNYVVMNYSKL